KTRPISTARPQVNRPCRPSLRSTMSVGPAMPRRVRPAMYPPRPKANSASSNRKRPDNRASAADASRQVGDVDEMDRPTATPNAVKTALSAAALSAPPMMELHEMKLVVARGEMSFVATSVATVAMSAKSQERQDGHHDDDQANEIDKTVHCASPRR